MPVRRSWILLFGLALGVVLACLPAPPAQAADPQPYSVHFASTGNRPLNALLRASSQLDSLRKSAPVSPFALVDRAQQDIGRLQSALQSYGYYESRALISIEGHALDDTALPGLLAALPKKQPAKVEVRFELGPLYHLGRIVVQGGVSPGATAALKLKSGDPAVAQEVLDAGGRLQRALEEEGHAYAKVDDPPGAVLQQAQHALDVTFSAHPGPVYTLGALRFEGLKLVKEPFLRTQIAIHPGDPYRASAIEQARQALLNLGVFAVVSVRLPPPEQVKGTVLPVTFVVNERKPIVVNFDGEYSSDLGIIGAVGWTDRNLFGRADQLAFNASVFGLGGNGTATNGVSYDLTGQLTLPDFLAPTQSLQFELQALKPELTAYTQIAAIGGVTLARKLSSVWNVSAGLSLEEEKIQQNEVVDCDHAVKTSELTPSASGALLAPPPDWCHYLLV
jgi:translocation and assembly module TamA